MTITAPNTTTPTRCTDLTRSPRGSLRCVLDQGHDVDPLSMHTIDFDDTLVPNEPRPSTPPEDLDSGGQRLTVKRCCNGCNREIGDVTDAEMDAAITGAELPDVRVECGCLAVQP